MTLRAFLIGLACVAGLCLLEPYTSFIKGYGWLTDSSFPTGAVVIVVFLTVGLNALLKLMRRRWALARPELMLVWCMLIVASAVPSGGLGRYWFGEVAGGPYLARRPDYEWEKGGALTYAPEALVLSRDPFSTAVTRYYEGTPDGGRVPWRYWARPLLHWGVFILAFYLAILLACGLLRRQWVDVERLMFPLARVPLEFTDDRGGGGLLPALFTNRAFVAGVVATAVFRLIRALPVFFGGQAWQPTIPLRDVLVGTPMEHAFFDNFPIMLIPIGLAFLVPADVSLSVWLMFLVGRFQLWVAYALALPEGGGSYTPLMRWQQFGAYVVFFAGMLFMARRHLWDVVRRAFGRAGPDDAREPVGYRWGFWGLVACVAFMAGWDVYHGMHVYTALVTLLLMFISALVYARLVAQGGLPLSENIWVMHRAAEGIVGTTHFSPAGALIATMQSGMLVTWPRTVLAPMAINSMRIASVLGKRRRLLVPALMAALVLAMVCTTEVTLRQAYAHGALNFTGNHLPNYAFTEATRIIQGRVTTASAVYPRPLVLGAVLMAFLMFMRARFYWWPVHPVGLLCFSGWNIQRLWFPFFLGWLAKVGILKLAGGAMLRKARFFFIGLIVTEAFFDGLAALVRTATAGAVPRF